MDWIPGQEPADLWVGNNLHSFQIEFHVAGEKGANAHYADLEMRGHARSALLLAGIQGSHLFLSGF